MCGHLETNDREASPHDTNQPAKASFVLFVAAVSIVSADNSFGQNETDRFFAKLEPQSAALGDCYKNEGEKMTVTKKLITTVAAAALLASSAAHADCDGPAPGCEIMNQRYHANDPPAAPPTEPHRANNPMMQEDNDYLGHNPNPEGNDR